MAVEIISGKPYRCSHCAVLEDNGEHCLCRAGVDPRPGHRVKADKSICLNNFHELAEEDRWHSDFPWEKKA